MVLRRALDFEVGRRGCGTTEDDMEKGCRKIY